MEILYFYNKEQKKSLLLTLRIKLNILSCIEVILEAAYESEYLLWRQGPFR